MYEHSSGLPHAYDRAAGRADMQSVVFYGYRPFIQAAELTEMQTIARERSRRVSRLVVSDGDRVERGDAIIDAEAGSVTISAGRVYADGDVWDVPEAVLAGVPMTGRVELGIILTTSYITHEDDPSLVGLVPGSEAEGEPGAAREIRTAAWALQDDDAAGDFYSVHVLQNGVILDQVGPNVLAPAMQAIQEYDRPNGNYIVSGCRVTAMGADAGAQVFTISEGEANINGMKRTRLAALRHAEAEEWDELAIPGETHTYAGGASQTFTVAAGPIGVVNSILLTKEKTVNVTRGAVVNGADGLPDTSVIQIVEVKQGATTYVAGTDFNRVNNTVDWAPAGAEPATGSSYTVKYRYRASVDPDAVTAYTITVSGGATGGDVIVAYTRRLPRVDRLCLAEDGSPVYLRGVSAAANPLPPAVPSNLLKLAQVWNDWVSTPTVTNDGTQSLSWDQMWSYLDRIVDLDRLVQLDRLTRDIDSREPVAKKGMFVDPFRDDTYRDAGVAQTGAIADGMLMLAIQPTFYTATLTGPVMLDWTEEIIVRQELRTGCELINPYANFTPLPGTLTLNPAVDFWTESRTDWLSEQTQEFNRGVTTQSTPLQTTTSETRLEDRRVEQIAFLRQIQVAFTIKGFGPGEQLATLTFDGIDVRPAGPPVANAQGQISGTFVIPINVTAGSKVIEAEGAGGTSAVAMFTGQGTIEVDVMRRVTTIETWTASRVQGRTQREGGSGRSRDSDPQAQLFAVTELRQILGIDFHVCAAGNPAQHIVVDQVSIDNGYPTTDVAAEAVVSMATPATGWRSARYKLPLTTSPERKHAAVIKTDSNEHAISIAKLGGFDTVAQRWITSHPYVTGPRFSSVNAETWTAHQDEALAFRIVAAKFGATTKTINLGSFNLVQCSDLQVRAAVELPSAGCSVVFEIERTNGTVYRLAPFQVLQLTEYITETVQLRAVLKGTEKLSPILYAPVELIAGRIEQELTYVTRAMDLGTAVRFTTYLKAFLPGGSTVAVALSIAGGAWVNVPLKETEALAYALWSERTYELTNQTGLTARLKITGTGGPASRLIIGDLGAAIF